jgi:transposase
LTGLCARTVCEYKKEIDAGNIQELLSIRGGGRKSNLADVEQEIIDVIEAGNYSTAQQIVDMIKEKFDIKTSLSAVSRLLKKHGIKRRKTGSLPAKADPIKQRNFYDEKLKPLMDEAKNGLIELLFMDASHFVMGCDFLGYIYGSVRRLVTTFSGRKRYNVLGALNFVSKKVTTTTNDLYINANSVCEFLRKISVEYAGRPIFLILDNARYQKCKIVEELAVQLGINLVFIPPYSPNLNLIERFWKHVKSRLRTRHYENFDIFRETIDSIISDADKSDKKAVDRLINSKVQLFDNIVPINETTFAYATKKVA